MKKKIFAICSVSIVLIAVLVLSCAPPEGQMGMDDAINLMKEDILPNIREVQEGNPYWCLKLDSPLPARTVIEEASGSRLRITLDKEIFFFYLDLAPGAYYAHDVKYILVDKNGNHEEHDARWWPLIDGEVPAELRPDIPNERDVIATNVKIKVRAPKTMLFDFPTLRRLLGCEGFIVVQGSMPNEPLYDNSVNDHNNRYNFFYEYAAERASACSQVVGLVKSHALDVFDTIDDMVADGLNPITISIIAHGDTDGVDLGGQWITVHKFRKKFAAHPYTIFNFILTSCHSGSFIDDLRTLNNVYVVATACRADESAYPDWDAVYWGLGGNYVDYNPEDSGAEWTSSLLEAMSQIVEDEAKFEAISSLAEGYGVPETSALIWMGSWGAVGANPSFGLLQNLDLCNRINIERPQTYTYWYLS